MKYILDSIITHPRLEYWDRMSPILRQNYIELATKYQLQETQFTPRAIIIIPDFLTLPETLAVPVKAMNRIVRFEEFNLKKLLGAVTKTKLQLRKLALFVRTTPYVPQNCFPLTSLWGNKALVMAAIRVGNIFFLTLQQPEQRAEIRERKSLKDNPASYLFEELERQHSAWLEAQELAKTTGFTAFELFRTLLTRPDEVNTTGALSELSSRILIHAEWIRKFDLLQHQNVDQLREHFISIQKQIQSITSIDHKLLGEYEEIIEMPHALYAITHPIQVGYTDLTAYWAGEMRGRIFRPRMPLTRYLVVVPKTGFDYNDSISNVRMYAGNEIGHPHLYERGATCYGNQSGEFGDPYIRTDYTSVLIRIAAVLRGWDDESLADRKWKATTNLVECHDPNCCNCGFSCEVRCIPCIEQTPAKFTHCDIKKLDWMHPTVRALCSPETFKCRAWQQLTLSLCCAANGCPYYYGVWTKTEKDLTQGCHNPCSHCPITTCHLRKNPYTAGAKGKKRFAEILMGIQKTIREKHEEDDQLDILDS